MNEPMALSAYPTITSKVWRRVRDLPHQLAALRDRTFPGEFARLYAEVQSYTMCGHARLRGLYEAVNYVVARNIPGDVVECGTARGGSAALLGLTLKQRAATRRLWVFDTFEGMPAPTAADPDYEVAQRFVGACCGPLEEVTELFRRLQILPRAQLVKGLVQTTLTRAEVGAIAVLHLDCDWYESVACCLEHLYDRVSPGGVIQIDDYGHWRGARRAVDEFLRRRGLPARLRYLDYAGRQLLKPPAGGEQ